LWERLRLKSHVPKEERDKLVGELFDIIRGNVKEYVFKHDSVRPVQCAVKYANVEQRKEIAMELKGSFKELAESKYAKFLVAKLLVGGDEELRETVVSEFAGHVKRTINHPEASWILDDTYRQIATQAQKALLLREWYGPEFALSNKTDKATTNPKTPVEKQAAIASADLSAILAANPEKRKPIMDHLQSLINQLVQKKLTGFTMLHDAMLQYSLNTGGPETTESTEFLELLKSDDDGDLLKNLAFTRSGARVVARALATSTAKDRKTILKVYKDNVETLAFDTNGHLVLLAAYEVVDDTVMVSKLIYPELLASKQSGDPAAQHAAIVAAALHPTARIALLYPFAADHAKWLLAPASSDAAKLVAEVRVLRTATAKKEPAARRAELAKALSTASDHVLLATITSRAAELASTSFGCQFMTEVLLGCTEGDKQPAMAALADVASGDPSAEGHVATSPAGGAMLKTLVSGGRYDPQTKRTVKVEPALGFAGMLWPQIKDWVVQWATGESSFVVVNMVDDEAWKERGDVLKVLKGERKVLEKADNKGAKLLMERL